MKETPMCYPSQARLSSTTEAHLLVVLRVQSTRGGHGINGGGLHVLVKVLLLRGEKRRVEEVALMGVRGVGEREL